MRLGRSDKAISDFSTILEIEADNHDAILARAFALMS